MIKGISYRGRKLADSLHWRVRIGLMKTRGQTRMALASYPRSGNTWFRFLLESATGEQTGTAGNRPSRVLARGHDGVVIKTHGLDSHRYTHAIHLVRSPFDVLDSFYDWKQSLGWEWKYGQVSWDEFVRICALNWQAHTQHWLRTSCQTHVIRYEDCRNDPVTHFSALLKWMGKDVTDEQLQRAIEATSFEKLKREQSAESVVGAKFFRRGQVNRSLERFTPEQTAWILDTLAPELIACGYDDFLETMRPGRPGSVTAARDS